VIVKKERLIIWSLQLFIVAYGVLTVYQLSVDTKNYFFAGGGTYYTDLLLPIMALFYLHERSLASEYFLKFGLLAKWLFYVFVYKYYLFSFYILIVHMPLDIAGKLIFFLAGAILVHKNKQLFQNGKEKNAILNRKNIAIILALSIPFLPFIEREMVPKLDYRVLDNQAEIHAIHFSPDGRQLIVINAGEPFSMHFLDMESKAMKKLNLKYSASSADMSADNQYLAIGLFKPKPSMKDVNIEVLNLLDNQKVELKRTEPFAVKDNASTLIRGVAFSPDNIHLASVTGTSNLAVEIWDITTGHLDKTLETGSTSVGLAYSPDGKYVATKILQGIGIWDTATGSQAEKLDVVDWDASEPIMYSADGKYLAIPVKRDVEDSDQSVFMDIWDVEAKQRVGTLSKKKNYPIHGFTYSPNGRYLATYDLGDSFIEIWDVTNGNMIQRLHSPIIDERVVDAAFSPDGNYLAVASGRYIKLYDARTIGQ